MRIRVSTVPPLSPARVWSSLSSLPSAATVNDLKHSLCTQIPALKGLRSDHIQLFVDDFELLDTLPTDVVRENDHVQSANIPSSSYNTVLTLVEASSGLIIVSRLQVRSSKTFLTVTVIHTAYSAQEKETFGLDHLIVFVIVVVLAFILMLLILVFVFV